MRILCVAEKPSAAKKIAGILSQSSFTFRTTGDTYVKNYEFSYTFNQQSTGVTMTSVRGHLSGMDFGSRYKSWRDCNPATLFDAQVEHKVMADYEAIAENLRQESRRAEVLFIWTDCDREGEAIGAEVMDVCKRVNPRLEVWRARFSAMQPADIHNAARQPTTLDLRQVHAVLTRAELDLRIGAAFTRLQTLGLASYFDDRKIVSYGSCQFPTLGFVVDRHIAIQNFVSEEFWKIVMSYTQEEGEPITTQFNWKRSHLFDRWVCFVLYEKCIQNPMATVTKVNTKRTSKWKPLPLTTVEMQKVACRFLRMTGEQVMRLAEELYTSGLISYPRTETDQFDKNFPFMSLIEKQCSDSRWGQYAQRLRDGEFQKPRVGRNNDKAHPPIHPTGYNDSMGGPKGRLYEFIVRRFLGCCWKDATGAETEVQVNIADEEFEVKGLVIHERNYLEVYTYDKWQSNELPAFVENDQFMPTVLELKSSLTQAPEPLTEFDLIGLMEKNEIGTDATIAEHIEKILVREYAYKNNQHFHPSSLGIALVLGYDEIGLDSSLSKPFLRREMEANLKAICQGTKDQASVLRESIEQYRRMFSKSSSEFQKILQSMRQHYRRNEERIGGRQGPNGSSTHGNHGHGHNDDDDNNDDDNFSGGANSSGGRGRRQRRGSSRGRTSARSRGTPRGRGRGEASRRGSARGASSRSFQSGNHEAGPIPPKCQCDRLCLTRTVTKEGPNKGRGFYKCPNDEGGCNHFEWADEAGGRDTHGSGNGTSHREAGPHCECGNPTAKRIVTKQTANQGRAFYSCSAGRDQGCNYFEWCDDLT